MELAPGPAAHGLELLLSQITMSWAVPQFRILPPGHMHVVVFIHLRGQVPALSGHLGFFASGVSPRNLLVQPQAASASKQQ